MDEHEIDDVAPNSGEFWNPLREPADQSVSRKKEKAATLEALTVLQSVVDRLEIDVAFYGSVDSIPSEVKANPEQFLIMHNANEMTRNALKKKKDYIQGLMDTHAPGR